MATSSLQPSTDRLALLYRLSQTFNSSLDLDKVLKQVMDEVIEATQAERGFVMLREADGELSFRAARGMDRRTIEDPSFQISRSVVERVAKEGHPILTSDAQSDDRFSMRQSVVSLGLRAILCVPLKLQDKLLGVVYVDNRLQAGVFTPADLDLLASIASSAAIAIENARLYQVAVEKGRLERELQMAHEVQVSFLPNQIPQLPGWEFAARWLPARDVSGDYYDFIPTSGGGLGLLIADVTDKGMPAALFMALSRSVVRASVDRAPSPAEGIHHANQLLCADSNSDMFVTLFYALLDADDGRVTYVNAGHNPPLLYRVAEGDLTPLELTGLPLGIFDEVSYDQDGLRLETGDVVLLYTDGVTDAVDAQMEAFGLERLQRVLLDQAEGSAADIVDALEGAIKRFCGPTAPFDDITMMVIKCQR